MKYAIYDKAADGYLTKMEFEVGYSEHTQFECGYNEYITEAQLLDTKKTADNVVARIEGCKFMEKGRFVVHSFDDTLKDQYIISEAGTPTKVVESITVDLDGTINVKYGTMISHWSTTSLEYVIARIDALQKAKASRYTAWCNTFDIYKVIKAIDEKGFVFYQFIKVTEKGIAEYGTDEIDSINKRIEELEKANHELGEQVFARGAVANRLQEENDNLKTKVESIKKEARNWKAMYENADSDREELKNKLEACEVVLDSTHDLLTKTIKEKDKAMDYCINDVGLTKEIHKYASIRDALAEVIYAIRNAIYDRNSDAFDCIKARMINDPDFNSDPFMAGIRENVKDICSAGKINITNNELKNSEIARLTKERDKALERAEKFKGIANSVYGMTIPGRCCGKQMFCDITTGKKILVDKEKYDDLMKCVNNISLTYEMMKLTPFSMDRPSWLSGIINRINNLTK